jgi:hypothetical protein
MTAILAHRTDNPGRTDIPLSAPDSLQPAVSSLVRPLTEPGHLPIHIHTLIKRKIRADKPTPPTRAPLPPRLTSTMR